MLHLNPVSDISTGHLLELLSNYTMHIQIPGIYIYILTLVALAIISSHSQDKTIILFFLNQQISRNTPFRFVLTYTKPCCSYNKYCTDLCILIFVKLFRTFHSPIPGAIYVIWTLTAMDDRTESNQEMQTAHGLPAAKLTPTVQN